MASSKLWLSTLAIAGLLAGCQAGGDAAPADDTEATEEAAQTVTFKCAYDGCSKTKETTGDAEPPS